MFQCSAQSIDANRQYDKVCRNISIKHGATGQLIYSTYRTLKRPPGIQLRFAKWERMTLVYMNQSLAIHACKFQSKACLQNRLPSPIPLPLGSLGGEGGEAGEVAYK
jgi:hypothetical protein